MNSSTLECSAPQPPRAVRDESGSARENRGALRIRCGSPPNEEGGGHSSEPLGRAAAVLRTHAERMHGNQSKFVFLE
jgi:hypothetical protein